MSLPGGSGEVSSTMGTNQYRNANGQGSQSIPNPVSRDRIFVNYFIPPPPPPTLPNASEYSDSDNYAEDTGYDISGLDNGLMILDLSEKIVQNATDEGRHKRKERNTIKRINVGSFLDGSLGGESESDFEEFRPRSTSSFMKKSNSLSSTTSSSSSELRSEIQRIHNDDPIKISNEEIPMMNETIIPNADEEERTILPITSNESPSDLHISIPTYDTVIPSTSSDTVSPVHSPVHSPSHLFHSPRIVISPTHGMNSDSSSIHSDHHPRHSPPSTKENTISERIMSPLPLDDSDHVSPNERSNKESSPVILANDVANIINHETNTNTSHVLSPFLRITSPVVSPRQTSSEEEKENLSDPSFTHTKEEEIDSRTPLPNADIDNADDEDISAIHLPEENVQPSEHENSLTSPTKGNRISRTLVPSSIPLQTEGTTRKRTSSIMYSLVANETTMSPKDEDFDNLINEEIEGVNESSTEEHIESEPEGEKKLRRVGRFGKSSILIDNQKSLLQGLEKGDYKSVVTIVNDIVNRIKGNERIVEEINNDELLITIRKLLVVPDTLVRCSALRLLRHICVNEAIVDYLLALKMHIFIIMSLERSEKLAFERNCALSFVTFLVVNYTHLIPRSLILSILNIGNDSTDPLRISCLKLILRLMMNVPERVVFCDGAQVLLNGCVETNNCSLLQSSLLACLFYLDSTEFRQKKTVLDLQIILDPLLIETKSVPESKRLSLQDSRYISNIALLTILRTWSGIFLFSGDMNGLNSYINILRTHGEEEPELAKQMLSVLFTVIGISTPSYLEEETTKHTNTIYWNNCSMFISSISKNRTVTDNSSGVNLLATYLSIIVWSLVNSKLPEILSSLMVSADNEVAFLAKSLLRNLIHLSSVFACMSDITTSRTAQQAMLSFQTTENDSLEELQRKARARNCFVDISSTSTYLYPILEKNTFVPCSLTDVFSSFSLFHCVLDCFCDEKSKQPYLQVMNYVCSQGIPFQGFVSNSYNKMCENKNYFMDLIKHINNMLSQPPETWKWNDILECLLIATTQPSYINMVADTIIYRLDNQLSFYPDRRTYGIANLPINCQSPIYATCVALWLMIIILADVSKVQLHRKMRIIKYGVDQLICQLEDWRNNKTGVFCLHNVKYTNIYFYLVIFIRLCYSSRIQSFLQTTSFHSAIQHLSEQEKYPQSNVFVLRTFVMNLDIIHDYSTASRNTFVSFLKNGPIEMKILCLSKIKMAFKEVDGDRDFASWAIKLLVSQINVVTRVTELIVDILYCNTKRLTHLNILIKCLIEYKQQAIPLLARLEAARPLIYRLITTEEGFKMFEDNDHYVMREFQYFMYDYIYDYVADIEDGLGVRIMQSPDSILNNPVMIDDPSLQVHPLILQPPSHIVFSYLRQSERKLEWLSFIPWRIEIEMITDNVKKIIDVDTEVDVTQRTPENSFFNREEISIHGVLFDSELQEERPLRVQPGSTLRAYLYMGTDCIINGPYCCEVRSTNNPKNPEKPFEQFAEEMNGPRRKESEASINLDERDDKNPELRRANIIKDYMICNGQCDYDEIHYDDVATKFKSVASGKSEFTFRYAKNNSSCIWRFNMSEGDIKASDITMGCSFNLHSIDFILDFIPHKPQPFTVQPHICGALFPTPAGRSLMKESIQFVDMSNVMLNQTLEHEENIQDRRAALWSLAHIAVQPKGIIYLERNCKINFVEKVIDMAEHDCSLSFRGSCLLVLSFISTNPEVRSIIKQYGWLCDDRNNNAICLPSNIDQFLSHVTYDKWQLPCCTHFTSSSTSSSHKKENKNLQSLNSLQLPVVKRSLLPRYSGLSSFVSTTSITDNSITSSFNSRRTRTNSFNSLDSRGNSLSMNFNESIYIDKTEECPSDIIINSIADHKDIIDLMHKISLLNSTVYSYDARLQIEEMKRSRSELFQDPLTLLCVHHMFSISLFPRGWRKFVFQLFDDIEWTDENWKEFDSCADHVMSTSQPTKDDSSSEDIGDVNQFVFNDSYDYNVLSANDLPQSSIQKSLNQMSLGSASSLGTPTHFSRSSSHSISSSFVNN